MGTSMIAEQMLESLTACLTPEVAQRITEMPVSAEVQARVDELARKANEGTLTAHERAEYVEYVDWADLIAIFKARAETLVQRGSE